MASKSLLFIPDISGFTNFINNTEIEHSQHIISELIENIIDSDHLGMEVSEIEGDAVFFYKTNDVPDVADIYNLAKKMFINFHAHLKLYDKQRICQCGACSSASKLSLKFVAHSAEIGFTSIKNNNKPFGTDIVLIHRLLKNGIKNSEYILFTNFLLESSKYKTDLIELEQALDGSDNYNNYGEVDYKYIPMTELHSHVPDPPPVILPLKAKNPIAFEFIFDLSLMESYAYLTNFNLKEKWNKNVKEFKYEKGKINRTGTKHTCVFDKGAAELESVTNDFGEGKLVYGEKIVHFPFAKNFIIYYILTEQNSKTKIRVEVHYQPLPLIGWLLKPIIYLNIKKNKKIFINSFSKLKREEDMEITPVMI